MANIQELLAKNKSKIEKLKTQELETPILRKKIVRTGPTRPWQDNLPQYQVEEASAAISHEPESALKPEPKWSQSEAKVEPQPEPKWSQSEAKVEPQPEPKKKAFNETRAKVEPQPEPQVEPIMSQSEAKVEPKHPFSALVGLQRNILIYIYESCRFNGEKISGAISIQNLVIPTKSTTSAVRKAIQRLEEKQFIKRVNFKDGRGGWTQYGLPEFVYNALLLNETRAKVEPNISQTRAKVRTEVEPQPEPSFPIVVVPNSLSLKTTNTESPISEHPCFIIPNELSGMVSRRQLSQFVLEGKISESELQMSLDAFAYDLKNKLVSTRHTANPVGLLIGAIKNNGGYNSQKFAEALKTEMKTALSSQQALQDSIFEVKTTEGWAKYQEMKTSSPEAYHALVSKYEKQGLKGELLEEFGFLEFQEQNNSVAAQKTDPLRPTS